MLSSDLNPQNLQNQYPVLRVLKVVSLAMSAAGVALPPAVREAAVLCFRRSEM
jgi:hypothetical protein